MGPYSVAAAVESLIDKLNDLMPRRPSNKEIVTATAKKKKINEEEAAKLEAIENQIKDPVPEVVFKGSKELEKNLVRHDASEKRMQQQKILNDERDHRSYEELVRIATRFYTPTSSSADVVAPSIPMSPGSSSSAAPTRPASCDATTSTSADTTLALQGLVSDRGPPCARRGVEGSAPIPCVRRGVEGPEEGTEESVFA